MSTKSKNRDLFAKINEGWLHQVGADGTYNRDRIAKQLGIQLDQKGGLSDSDRKRFQSAVESELGFKLPGGVEIDPAGNANENEGAGKWAKDWRT